MLETLLSFTISLLIGLLIGIERERSHPEGTQFIGVRTFAMLSILGTLVASLNQVGLTITASAFVFGMLLLNYFPCLSGCHIISISRGIVASDLSYTSS